MDDSAKRDVNIRELLIEEIQTIHGAVVGAIATGNLDAVPGLVKAQIELIHCAEEALTL